VVHAYNSRYVEGGSRRIMVWGFPGKRVRPYLKKKRGWGLGKWLKWFNNYLASTRPWVQSSIPPKTKTKQNKTKRTYKQAIKSLQ
jgi:hypothetical protein